jgi:predicted nucleic acid-binding protein
MSRPFLDTNVLLRHLLADELEQSPRATACLARIEQGEFVVRTSDLVVFETVFTLQRQYRRSKAEIREAVLALLELPGILLPGKRHYRRVFELYVDDNLPFADAYHVVLVQRLGMGRILSFDKDFDGIPGLERVAP